MQRGSSLLEVLLSSAVLSCLAAGTLINLSNSRGLGATALIQSRDYYSYLRVEALLRRSMEDLDTHRLWLPPRIHTMGRIRYQDGSINRASIGSRRPNSKSDALTSGRLISVDSLAVKHQSSAETSSTVTACAKYKGSVSLSEIRNVIALSPEGFRELLLLGYAPAGTPGCYQIQLAATKSMIAPSCEGCVLGNLATIIPIREISTIYLDRQGELRYLSHAGERNLENQPLLLESRLEYLKLELSSAYAVHFLTANLNFKGAKSRTLLLHNSLARQAIINLLVN